MAIKVKTTVRIKGGEEFNSITGVSVHQKTDWHCTFQFGVKVDERIDILLQYTKDYIGKEVEILLDSPKAAGTNDFKFLGIITDLGFSNSLGGTQEIIFRGFSPTILLDDNVHYRSFTEKELKKITNEVLNPASSYFSDLKINPNLSEKLSYVVQYEETNFHFLSRIASKFGEWFFYDGEKIIFGKLPASETIELTFGTHLSGFNYSAQIKPKLFQTKSYNYEKNEILDFDSSSAESNGLDQTKSGKAVLDSSQNIFSEKPLNILPNIKNKERLKNLVSVQSGGQESSMIAFSGQSDFPKIKIGSKIKVSGLFNTEKEEETPEYGEFIIVSISHSASEGNYQNRFQAIPANVIYPPKNGNINPIVANPQIGVVKHNDDEKKMGRVRVQLTWQDGTSELTPWIRVTSSYAGKDRGLYLLPEVGEEVIVNFDWDDPEKPFVAGSFYHGKSKPDKWFDPDNNKKVFKTKSGNQIEIDDTSGKETIKIFNPKSKNIISLSLDGEAQITIETEGKLLLKGKDIEMESETLKIKASSEIDIETRQLSVSASQEMEFSTQQMTLDGGQKLEMKGMKSKLEALSAEVTASTKLDLNGGAMANLKAALVKIN